MQQQPKTEESEVSKDSSIIKIRLILKGVLAHSHFEFPQSFEAVAKQPVVYTAPRARAKNRETNDKFVNKGTVRNHNFSTNILFKN